MTETMWGYSSCPDPEQWTGACSSRDEAIAEALAWFGNDAEHEPFWICSGTKCDPASFMHDLDWLLDDASERAGEAVGDAAEDWPPAISHEARGEFTEFVNAWARNHLPCTFWVADGKPEKIEATCVAGERRSP